jgi:hypothetical protein
MGYESNSKDKDWVSDLLKLIRLGGTDEQPLRDKTNESANST